MSTNQQPLCWWDESPPPEPDANSLWRNPFVLDMAEQLALNEQAAHFNTLHEAWAFMRARLDAVFEIARQPPQARNGEALRQEVIQLAALTWQTARDGGFESAEGDG